jgi:carboxyl-terminal processing protease
MRGAAGTTIRITLLREGLKEPLSITLKRDVIKIQSVRSRAEDDIIYLRVTSFSENTGEAMKAAYEKEKKTIGPKLKGVVLDLRNNPGGLLDQAIAVSDAFLEQGEIVSTRSRKPEESRRFSATAGDIAGGLPMVVLINEGSASASEIVAGALKDHKRAVALGTKSFGKGSVQTVIPIDGHGAIRLTTARYYTPSGVSIQATGIVPDILVEQAKLEPVKNTSNFSEAALRGHLTNDQASENAATPAAPAGKKDDKKDEKKDDKKEDKKDDKKDDKKEGAANDYQLSRALDLIHALSIYSNARGDLPAVAAATTEAAPAIAAPRSMATPPTPAKK